MSVNQMESAADSAAPVPLEPSLRWRVVSAFTAVVTGALGSFVTSGVYLSFGVIYSALLEEFGTSRFFTALVGSAQEFMFSGGCAIVPAFIQRYGFRSVHVVGTVIVVGGTFLTSFVKSVEMWIVTYGVFASSGLALVFMVAIELGCTYTPRTHRGLCMGTIFAGSGAGVSAIVPALTNSVKARGLSTSMRWLALFMGASSIVILLLLLGIYRFGHRFVDPKSQQCLTDRQMENKQKRNCFSAFVANTVQWFRNPTFTVMFVALTVYLFGFFVPFAHIVQYSKDIGLDADDSGAVLMVLGIANLIGRILFGLLGDATGNFLLCFTWVVLQNGVSVLLLPFCTSYASLVAFAVICGTSAGGRSGLLSLVSVELFGQEHGTEAYGLLCISFCISQTFGSPVVGALHDYTDSYKTGFLAAGTVMVSAVPLFLLLLLLRHRRLTTMHDGAQQPEA